MIEETLLCRVSLSLFSLFSEKCLIQFAMNFAYNNFLTSLHTEEYLKDKKLIFIRGYLCYNNIGQAL